MRKGAYAPFPFKKTRRSPMIGSVYSFLFYGLSLTVIFAVIIFYYYSKKRKDAVEEAKYKMLDDDDD
jgi:cbb3-type cytochrome oxidase subunit 3